MTISEAKEIQSLIDLELEKLIETTFSLHRVNLTHLIRKVNRGIGDILMVNCLQEEITNDYTRV